MFLRFSIGDPRDLDPRTLVMLRSWLQRTGGVQRRLVIPDGIFSMDGEVAPLPGIVQVAVDHDSLMMVDDTHGAWPVRTVRLLSRNERLASPSSGSLAHTCRTGLSSASNRC